MKITPENITGLKENEIFTYGANEGGRHGAGAAKLALKWGAKYGEYGLNGQTYGIPTKDKNIKTLSLEEIKKHVEDFFRVAYLNQDKIFLVTKIGCGLANYKAEDIAPLFKQAKKCNNVCLPQEFWDFIRGF